MLPFIQIILSIAITMAPFIFRKLSLLTDIDFQMWRNALLIYFVTFLALSPVLISNKVSELYLMGPNIGSSLLIAVSVVTLKNNQFKPNGKIAIIRTIQIAFVVTLLMIFSIGLIGLISRARNFAITWHYSCSLNQKINNIISSTNTNGRAIDIYVSQNCQAGRVHSVYFVPPSEAVNIQATEDVINEYKLTKKVNFHLGSNVNNIPNLINLDCSDLPKRPTW
jgi:hypothetical protein